MNISTVALSRYLRNSLMTPGGGTGATVIGFRVYAFGTYLVHDIHATDATHELHDMYIY